jgi:ElaB/YqjD/DUF883 family membrane-anchored ribosome-binding protein
MAAESETERIRQQMSAQRAALGDKLETLEHKIVSSVQAANDAVRDTIRDAKGGVEATVNSVRESVQASVASVHDSLDVLAQVDRHPWGMFAGSIAAGFIAGLLLNRANNSRRAGGAAVGGGHVPQGPSLLDHLSQTFAPEIQQLKGLAIGAAAGFVRDKVNQSVPDAMRSQVTDLMDNVATRLSGEHERVPAERS